MKVFLAYFVMVIASQLGFPIGKLLSAIFILPLSRLLQKTKSYSITCGLISGSTSILGPVGAGYLVFYLFSKEYNIFPFIVNIISVVWLMFHDFKTLSNESKMYRDLLENEHLHEEVLDNYYVSKGVVSGEFYTVLILALVFIFK
jgi:hypothetical protein